MPVSFSVISLTFLFAMNNNFRQIFSNVPGFFLDLFISILEIHTQFPAVNRAWVWVRERTVTPFARMVKMRKRTKKRKGKRVAGMRKGSKAEKGINDEKRRGEMVDAIIGGGVIEGEGTRKRVRWRSLFVGSKVKDREIAAGEV